MHISATEEDDSGSKTRSRTPRASSRLSRSRTGEKSSGNGAQRFNKQQFLRAQGMLQFERTTCITPDGFRSVRLHPSTDSSNQMNKYRSRPSTAIGIVASKRNVTSKTEPEKRKPPVSAISPSPSSMSNPRPSSSRSLIYTVRNSQCSPPEMYRHDNLRAAARETQGRLSRSSSGTRSNSGTSLGYSSSIDIYSRDSSKRSDIAYRFGEPVQRPKFIKNSPFLNHSDLTMGQKQYIWGIARVYSVDQLKRLRQKQYQGTLNYEYTKRVITKNLEDTQKVKLWKEYLMYDDFIKRYATGLPRRHFETLRGTTKPTPHRHSCVPWLKTEKEPRTYPDRIILHEPNQPGRPQSRETEDEDEILMSHIRPQSAPPDSFPNYLSEDDEVPNEILADTDDEPRASPTSTLADDQKENAESVTDIENRSQASNDELPASPVSDVIEDPGDGNVDVESVAEVESRSHTPYEVITEGTDRLTLQEPDDNYL